MQTTDTAVAYPGCPGVARTVQVGGETKAELLARLTQSGVEQPVWQHRAPPGAITIASEILSEDDEFPKGFYLRRIKGTLWLRGYWSGPEHICDPEDHFVFCQP